MAARYQWREPKAAKGDRVTFVDQYGHPAEGEVVRVVTRYQAEGRAGVQRARHTYSVHRGRRRQVNIGDAELLQVIERAGMDGNTVLRTDAGVATNTTTSTRVITTREARLAWSGEGA